MTNFHSKKFILKYIECFPNDKLTVFFRLVYDGRCYAGNSKRKTNTRVSVIIPKDIAKDNLKYIENYVFFIVGVKIK